MNQQEFDEHWEREGEAALTKLGEFFDTVQILVTSYDPEDGGTFARSRGVGNWYARQGQLKAFATMGEESIRCDERNLHKDEDKPE